MGSLWRPQAIFLEQFVGQDDELSHDGGDGHFFWFTCCDQALVEDLELIIPARRRLGCHIDAVAHDLAAAADMAGTVALPAVASDRCQPGQHASLFAIDRAEFGHVG